MWDLRGLVVESYAHNEEHVAWKWDDFPWASEREGEQGHHVQNSRVKVSAQEGHVVRMYYQSTRSLWHF